MCCIFFPSDTIIQLKLELLEYLNTFNFRAPFIFAPFIFAPLIFTHPLKMNFRAPFNFRASHKIKGAFGIFLVKNIDKKGKKETKLDFLLTFGVLSSQNLHPNDIFNLNRVHFAQNEY